MKILPTSQEIISSLLALANPKNVEGMARFGISSHKTLGITVKELLAMAKIIGKNQTLAEELWYSGWHEARILACLVSEPKKVTEELMERWVLDFDSWDTCDQCCGNVFAETPFAVQKVKEWSKREEEFVKRAGFSLIAQLPVHQKKAPNELYLDFLPDIIRESSDNRNFVRKAVNWALRQIGKQNAVLNRAAISTAEIIHAKGDKSSRWIASDALRELKIHALRFAE